MSRLISYGSLLGLTLAAAVSAAAAEPGSVSMAPPRTRLLVEPGGQVTTAITITNDTSAPLQGRVQLADWTIENGAAEGLRYSGPGTQPRSCTRWLEAFPAEFELDAWGGRKDIVLSAVLPEEAEGGYFGALIVELRPRPLPAAQGVSIQAAVKLGHLIVLDTEGRSTWAGSVEAFSVSRPDDTRSLAIEALIRNTGNTAIRPEGSFAITDEAGNLVGKVPMRTYLAQPGGGLRVSEPWDGLLEPGRYQVVGTLDLGGDQFLTPELAFEVLDKLELAGLEVRERGGKTLATIRVANLGNITATLTGRLRVKDGSGTEALWLDAGSFTVLPAEAVEQHFDLGDLAPGAYELSVSLQGGIHVLEARHAFRSP